MTGPVRRAGPLSRGAFAVALLGSLAVFFVPASGVPTAPPGVDKVVHGVVFLVLALTGRWTGLRRSVLLPALVAYAVLSELVQGLAPLGRSASPADVVADLAGILLGLAVFEVAGRRSPVP